MKTIYIKTNQETCKHHNYQVMPDDTGGFYTWCDACSKVGSTETTWKKAVLNFFIK